MLADDDSLRFENAVPVVVQHWNVPVISIIESEMQRQVKGTPAIYTMAEAARAQREE